MLRGTILSPWSSATIAEMWCIVALFFLILKVSMSVFQYNSVFLLCLMI